MPVLPSSRMLKAALLAATLVLTSLAAGAFATSPVAAALPYDERADARQDLQHALDQARDSNRRVLIVFGANWCPDCRVLNRELTGAELSPEISSHFVLVKVDVGHFDKNLDFARIYGDPTGKGIPSIVVVTSKNEVVYETRAGELANAREMGRDAIHHFFQDLADRPAGY